jgi:predicted ATPase
VRLDHFWIGDYKNLKDVTIDFDEGHWVTVVIGWNGTGKSNVLEALATLFRDLVMGENHKGEKNKPSFPYRLRYQMHGKWWVHIDADPKRDKESYQIHIKPVASSNNSYDDLGESISLNRFRGDQENYLPKYIFGYYSGTSERMQEVFKKYLVSYDTLLRRGKEPGFRRLFYALPVHSQFVLLAFILQQDEVVKEFLNKQLGLEEDGGIDSVLFVLKQPPWDRTKNKEIFWGAEGIVRKFLDRLLDISLAPISINRRVEATLWNKKTRGFRYLYVKDLDALRDLVGNKEPRDFFRDLESTYVSELIEEVRIRVKLRKNDGAVTFRELSEGEQQLLTVLGLLRFTTEEESLFLLDEPDTHLNPSWCVDYLQHLKNFIGANDTDRESSHIVLTTHNPLAVAELVKGQVQILSRNSDTLAISAFPPDVDPRGMGYAGIVTSDMFGLAAAVDNYTLDLLKRKRELAAKDTSLTNEERGELSNINSKLDGYGFRYETRDPVFTEYLKARYELEEPQPRDEEVTQLSQEERLKKAKKLVQRALERAGKQDS